MHRDEAIYARADARAPQPLDLEAGYEAVYALIRQWHTDAYENARIWRAVAAFSDAIGIGTPPTTMPSP